jgi:hypothetical protein
VRAWWCGVPVIAFGVAACGRIGFDPFAGGDARGDGGDGGDAPLIAPAPFAIQLSSANVDDPTTAVARDRAGNLYFGGNVGGAATLGQVALTTYGGIDGVVFSMTPDGMLRWQHSLGGGGDDHVWGIAVDTADNVYVAGRFTGVGQLGDMAVASAGGTDGFLVSFTQDGTWRFTKQLGGTGDDEVGHVAVDALDRIYVTGFFSASVDFGGGARAAAGPFDAYVASYASDSSYRWDTPFGGAGTETGNTVAVADSSTVAVVGLFSSSVVVNAVPYTPTGGYDVFAATADTTTGALVQFHTFGSAMDDFIVGLTTGAGTIFAAGGAQTMITSYPLTPSFAGGKSLFWRVQTDGGTDTSASWSSTLVTDLVSACPTASGNLILSGQLRGTADFGGGPLTAQGNDGVIVEVTSDGSYAHAAQWGGPADELLNRVEPQPDGSWILLGMFTGSIDTPAGTLTSAGNYDAVFMRIPPMW